MKNVSFDTMSHMGSIEVLATEGGFQYTFDNNPLFDEMVLHNPSRTYFQIHTPRQAFENGIPVFLFEGLRAWQQRELPNGETEAYPKATLIVVRSENRDGYCYKWQTHPNPLTGESKQMSYLQSTYWEKKMQDKDTIGFFMPEIRQPKPKSKK